MRIQIHRILERTKMVGPGWRFCIWVQGCSLHCKGCMAKEIWSHNGGTAVDTDDLFRIISATPNIEGVTFLGGEPFEQSEAVAILAEMVQTVGFSIVTFTGFTYDKLCSFDNPHIRRLLNATDLLIDSPFIHEQFDLSRPWVGSANQQYHFLSSRYAESDISGIHNQVEIRIAPNGETLINGMGDFEKIKKLL